MLEILWHGRGGQGAFTAAKLLGAAFTLSDKNNFALAFPSFGPERRGAPVRAFNKLDTKPIGNRSEVEQADFSIFLDDTLFSEKAFEEIKPNGKIILNTKRPITNDRVITLDADKLAAEILKLPITNTVMLGAFIAVFDGVLVQNQGKNSGQIPIEAVEDAIRENMPERLQEKNIKAIRAAMREVWRESSI